jgi:nitrate/TMAO reductase-like tetraheme cytochrome c subunit
MSRPGIVAATFCLMLLLAGSALAARSPVFTVDREFYPYYPSLLQWNKSTVPFNAPEVCGGCHEQQYREWNGSIHSLAFKDPVYQGELVKAVKAVGHEISRQCEGCHSAAGMVTGEVKGPGLTGLSSLALQGVSCDVCHSVSGVTHWQTPSHEPENGSLILSPGVETVNGQVLIKRGPFPPGPDCGGGFHDCAESGLHLKAELCAGCHQVYHYDAHFPLEATYLEWKHGPYAQQTILCQDCHMVDTATFKRVADEYFHPAREDYRHYFNGANYLLSFLGAAAAKKAGDLELAENLMKQYDMAVARLQAAAGLELTPVYQEGRLRELQVRVKNLRAGHNLPTSLTNVRQMWLEVTARDETGRILLSSGSVQGDGTLPENTRMLNSDGMGSDFHFAIDPWVVTAFSRHDTIPPKGYKDLHYGLRVPDGVKEVTLEVKLRYRQADQKVAEALLAAVPKDINLEKIYGLSKVPPLPVVDMATSQERFPASR